MAASRTTSNTVNSALTASGRLSFAKIREPLEVPDLLALQTDSFDWLVGNERWQERRRRRRRGRSRTSPEKSGLEEIFEEISPIEDFSEHHVALASENPVFDDPKYTVEECKEKDFTYSAPLYVTGRVHEQRRPARSRARRSSWATSR